MTDSARLANQSAALAVRKNNRLREKNTTEASLSSRACVLDVGTSPYRVARGK
jgi:hypothetical protein